MDKLICTWFGIGWLRPAPGTWASALAIVMGIQLHRIGHFPLLVLATLLAAAVGYWAVGRYTKGMSDPDRSEIVIDEVAGQWLALSFPSFGFWHAGLPADSFPYPGWVAAFVLFRLFDIWKPWLIGHYDRRKDAVGIMSDDLLAGLFAGIGVIILAGIAHGIFM